MLKKMGDSFVDFLDNLLRLDRRVLTTGDCSSAKVGAVLLIPKARRRWKHEGVVKKDFKRDLIAFFSKFELSD